MTKYRLKLLTKRLNDAAQSEKEFEAVKIEAANNFLRDLHTAYGEGEAPKPLTTYEEVKALDAKIEAELTRAYGGLA